MADTGVISEEQKSLWERMLKTADGTEIKTAASYVSADEVWAGNVTRVSTTIMSPELVHLGDEISFWYDGSFLGTVIAKEF